jgi:hypothetical protein
MLAAAVATAFISPSGVRAAFIAISRDNAGYEPSLTVRTHPTKAVDTVSTAHVAPNPQKNH